MFKSKGFIASSKVLNLKDELKTNHFYLPLLKNKFNPVKANKLKQLAKKLEAEKIKIVFYELPSNKLYTFFNKTYLDNYKNFISELRENYSVITVEQKPDESHYRDQDHLNTKGAAVASKAIIQHIMNDEKLMELYLH